VTAPTLVETPAVRLYLDLLKGVLMRTVPGDPELAPAPWVPATSPLPRRLGHAYVQRFLRGTGMVLARPESVDRTRGARGGRWPRHADTMIGAARLDNVEHCVTTCLREGVPGDLVETGVWRGGATILMRAVLAAHGVTDRTVWVADSFEGLPPPDPDTYPADAGDLHHTKQELAVSREQVEANFARYGLLDEQVRFLQGWFEDTLPTAPIERLAVMRLDGDMYSSTIQALEALYPRLSVGGFVIVDDYGEIEQARAATEDFRAREGITDEVVDIDGSGVYWRRTR
jgi:O-methyltransferase